MMNRAGYLYTKLHEKLKRFVGSRVSDQAIVEDLVQEIFLETLTYMERVDYVRQPEALIFTIARRRVIDYYRTRPGYNELKDSHTMSRPQKKSQLEILRQHELLEPAVHYLLDQLPDIYRQVLLLTELKGWSNRAVAKELGISLSAVKSRVSRGRRKLQQLLYRHCHVQYDRGGGISDCTPKCHCNECISLEIETERNY